LANVREELGSYFEQLSKIKKVMLTLSEQKAILQDENFELKQKLKSFLSNKNT
jgi:regulator of replication initiation timing